MLRILVGGWVCKQNIWKKNLWALSSKKKFMGGGQMGCVTQRVVEKKRRKYFC